MGDGAGDRTIAFLDLTRFTALNDTHGDETAVGVLDLLLDAVEQAVEGHGRVVKTLGDGVLLDVATPGAAVEVAASISRRLHELDHMPELTGGVATGPVVERGADVLGATVNLAARLADLATAGEAAGHRPRRPRRFHGRLVGGTARTNRDPRDASTGVRAPGPALQPPRLCRRPGLRDADHPRGRHPDGPG